MVKKWVMSIPVLCACIVFLPVVNAESIISVKNQQVQVKLDPSQRVKMGEDQIDVRKENTVLRVIFSNSGQGSCTTEIWKDGRCYAAGMIFGTNTKEDLIFAPPGKYTLRLEGMRGPYDATASMDIYKWSGDEDE